MHWLRMAGWLVACIYCTIPSYWFAVHPFTAYWRRKRGSVFKPLGLFWLALIILAGLITWRWNDLAFYQSWYALVPAMPFFAGAFYLYSHLDNSFTSDMLIGRPEVNASSEQQLVTTGIHARVRHPIYLAHLLHMTAWLIVTGSVVIFCMWAFAIITGAVMIRMEERELLNRFGDAYRAYSEQAGLLIPRERRRNLKSATEC
jgi:protein-S-isoprenylcysteine O-methyltransferase Ste14